MNTVYLDGSFLPENEALIPVSDRGLLMGDGVFVTIQVREGQPLFLKRHLLKLKEQISKLYMAPLGIEESFVKTLIEKNGAYEGVWRLKIYYTAGDDMAMHLPTGRKGRLLMILKPYTVTHLGSLKLGVYPHPISTPQSGLKTLSHLGRYMIMEHALRCAFDDCITTTEKGTLLETAFGNIFWIEDNQLLTPHPTLPLHFGITISVICEMVKEWGMDVKYVRQPFAEMGPKAHLFRCNTMGGIRPISHFEGSSLSRDLGLEDKLQAQYQLMCQKEMNKIPVSI